MATAKIDTDIVKVDEQYGVIVAAERTIILTDVAGSTIQDVVENALADSSVPAHLAEWSTDPNDSTYNLIVRNRSLELLHADAVSGSKVKIVLNYELDYAAFNCPIRGGSSLKTIETERDKDGNPIKVKYKGHEYLSKISVPVPEGYQVREITYQTNDPEKVKKYLINKVNADEFASSSELNATKAEPGQWLISAVDYEPVSLIKNDNGFQLWKFIIEMTYDEGEKISGSNDINAHKYITVYQDEDGEIPSDVTITATPDAIKIVDIHNSTNFNDIFYA